MTAAPLAKGSISLRLYPHLDRPAPAIVAELRAQATLAAEHGFDGVMTSEHHGGFAGYLPNPLQVAGWLLEAMPMGWAAACPLLVTLRPPALVAEEVAWLAARFPNRVGLGLAAGALAEDFAVMGLDADDLAARFSAALADITGMLGGSRPGRLSTDPAVAACKDDPIPMVSAAAGLTAVRRAAAAGVGVLFDSLTAPDRSRQLSDAYRQAGGQGPCILIRRAWVGAPPQDRQDRQIETYRGYSAAGAQAHWTGQQLASADDPGEVAAALGESLRQAGCDTLNFRVHVPGVPLEAVREQIIRLGDEVLPVLRRG